MNIVRAALTGLLLAPVVAFAQGPVSTASTTGLAGSDPIDLAWNVAINGGSPFSAFVLTRGPGWIGASPTGSLPGGSADQVLNRFLYSYSTTFNGAGNSGISYQCVRDDLFASVILNGATVATAGCDRFSPTTTFTLSGFNPGANTLTFNTSGNGVTDGFMLDVTGYSHSTSTVPEPGSLALLATGLMSLVGVTRTRNKRQASR